MLICIEKVLDAELLGQFRESLARADWQEGAHTAGALARQVKHNQQLDDDSPLARHLGDIVLERLQRHPQFIAAALPLRLHPPKFNRYAQGGHYGLHVDSALMPLREPGQRLRSDLSATLFLSEPEDYEGGELRIEGPFGAQDVKLAAGDLVLYPASSLHCVTPVTRGTRLACFLWLQSLVRDDAERSLLFDLDRAIQSLRLQLAADDARLLQLSGVYHNLLRRWAQT